MDWLHHDHAQFESAVFRCRQVYDAKDWTSLRRLFDEFASNYESHVRAEETVLFPAYDAHAGVSKEPTASLKADHTQIFRLIKSISQQLEPGNYDGVPDDLSLLYQILTRHHEKEEEVFLPMASDALLAEKEKVLSAFQQLGRQAGADP